MSRVESSDDQRIREQQEAQRKADVRNRAADRSKQNGKAFDAALRQKSTDRAGQQSLAKRAAEDGRSQARQVLDQLRQKVPRQPHELAKRAALSRAFAHQGAMGRRAQESAGAAQVLEQRAGDYLESVGREDRHLQAERIDEETREGDAVEENLELKREEQVLQTQIEDALGRGDGRRRGGGQQSDEREREREAAPTQAVAAPKGAAGAPTPVPPQLLKRIVGTLLKVAEDGRVRLRVKLQGPGLDGVELDVRHQNGRIDCAFSGCSDRLRRDLERSKDALAQALGRKGLTLGQLSAR